MDLLPTCRVQYEVCGYARAEEENLIIKAMLFIGTPSESPSGASGALRRRVRRRPVTGVVRVPGSLLHLRGV